MTRSFHYHVLLLLLAGCDPKPPKPVAPVAVFGLKAKVTTPATGEIRTLEWSVPANEIAEPAQTSTSVRIQPTRESRVIEVMSTRAHSLIYKVATDGTRFVVVKGGTPFYELKAVDEARAVEEALEYCRIQAAREFYGNP